MSDLYQKFANSSVGSTIIKALNLPAPVPLKRQSRSDEPLLEGHVLMAAPHKARFSKPVAALLDSTMAIRWGLLGMAPNAHDATHILDPHNLPHDVKFKALVFDASGLLHSEQLKPLYEFFHAAIKMLDRCGRIVVIGCRPDDCKPAHATAQAALEGFVRSVSKEIGKKGATADLIYAQPGVTGELAGPLRFLLSSRSAYVNAQVISVAKVSGKAIEENVTAPLAGKVALVTGGARGIGEAIAQTMARYGARVIVLDVPAAEDALGSVARQINGKALALDITRPEAPQVIAEFCKEHFGGLDIVVHNAGVTRDKTLGRMPEHYWDLLMDINLNSIQRIDDALLEQNLLRAHGRIIGVSSISGIAGNYGQTNYAASKAGVIGYTRAMSNKLPHQITINAVAPGFIETKMTAAIPLMIREAGRRMNSLSQGGQPVDVAETIAFLASPGAQGVSGNVIRVCGQSILGK